jgi:hypothetical protein
VRGWVLPVARAVAEGAIQGQDRPRARQRASLSALASSWFHTLIGAYHLPAWLDEVIIGPRWLQNARLHGGHILAGNHPCGGAVFTVSLPLNAPGSPLGSAAAAGTG